MDTLRKLSGRFWSTRFMSWLNLRRPVSTPGQSLEGFNEEHIPVQRDSIVCAGEEVKGGSRDGGEQHLVQPITRLGNSNHHKIAILR